MLDEKDHAYIAALAATIASETARQSDEEVMEVITDVSARLRVAWAHRLQPKFMDTSSASWRRASWPSGLR